MTSGALTITGDPGIKITQTGGVIIGAGREYNISKSFTVSASAPVQEPATADGKFKYGIVQNVMYDHIEETFTEGEMLVDSVGPLVDVADKSEIPFLHANQQDPSILWRQKSAMPSFTDVPSLDVGPSLHCNKKRWVKPLRVVRSIASRPHWWRSTSIPSSSPSSAGLTRLTTRNGRSTSSAIPTPTT
jgi:hypothetical protein